MNGIRDMGWVTRFRITAALSSVLVLPFVPGCRKESVRVNISSSHTVTTGMPAPVMTHPLVDNTIPAERLRMLLGFPDNIRGFINSPSSSRNERVLSAYNFINDSKNRLGIFTPTIDGVMADGEYKPVYLFFTDVFKIKSFDGIRVLSTDPAVPDIGSEIKDPWYKFSLLNRASEAALMYAIDGNRYALSPEETSRVLDQAETWIDLAGNHMLATYKIPGNFGSMTASESASLLSACNTSAINQAGWRTAHNISDDLDLASFSSMSNLFITKKTTLEAQRVSFDCLMKKDPSYNDYVKARDGLFPLSKASFTYIKNGVLATEPLYSLADRDHVFLRMAIMKGLGDAYIGMVSKSKDPISARTKMLQMATDTYIDPTMVFTFRFFADHLPEGAPIGLDQAALTANNKKYAHDIYQSMARRYYSAGTSGKTSLALFGQLNTAIPLILLSDLNAGGQRFFMNPKDSSYGQIISYNRTRMVGEKAFLATLMGDRYDEYFKK